VTNDTSAGAAGHGCLPDRLLALAAELSAQSLETPMAAVALHNPDGTWRNYLYGLPDDWSFRELPGVREALDGERMLMRSGPAPSTAAINFIAVVPLPNAALAVMDRGRRELNRDQVRALCHLAEVVGDILAAARDDNSCPASGGAAGLSLRMDLTGKILALDPTAGKRLGYDRDELVGRNLAEIVDPSESASAVDGLLAQLGSGGWRATNLTLFTPAGERVLVRAQTRLAFERGVPVAVELLAQDLSSEAVRMEALRNAEQALTEKAEELASFSEHLRQLHRLATSEYASLEDLLSEYLRTGAEMLRMPLGVIASSDPAGGALKAVYPASPSLDCELASNLGRLLASSAVMHQATFGYPFDPMGIEPSGQSNALLACYIGTPIYAGDELCGAVGFCSIEDTDVRKFSAHDREVLELLAKSLGRSFYEDQLRRERTRLTVELARQAQQDPLTGLSNRLQFMKHFESALAKATQNAGTLAVAFIDIDRFKQVNDTFGHTAGDEVLRQLAARLEAEAGAEEWVARVGGDEFTILFGGNPTREDVALTAKRLLDVLRMPYPAEGTELFLTATMGISFFPEDGSEARHLLQRADAAMYRAKSQGKNDFRFFTPDLTIRGTKRMELETQLRRALERGELHVSFMPLVATDSGSLESFEALLAWSNPRFGNVGASRFIPIAEESGMIIPIGTWVLNEICRTVADWQNRGLPAVRVAINVSSLQFARPDFVDVVSKALRQSGLPPQCLEIELTESVIMRDVESSARRMAQLRDVGVSFAIDDFGTGYSSLSYLRRLPVNTLKIDQSFVAELGSAGTALPLIHAVVVLAHNFGLSVVAEGVETREQLDLLRAVGCDRVQGHIFGEPLTGEAVEALMRRPGRDVPLIR
jgi:diguanylate cyclase (GGDEF)-like protein/PAS domain S-box-containing protein